MGPLLHIPSPRASDSTKGMSNQSVCETSDLSDLEVSECSRGSQEDEVVIGCAALPRKVSLLIMMELPRDANDAWLSRSTVRHADGGCTPCRWFRAARGCKDGVFCKMCHEGHQELNYNAIKREERRRAKARRRLFEHREHPPGMGLPPTTIKNTFIHLEDVSSDEESGPRPRRSVSH